MSIDNEAATAVATHVYGNPCDVRALFDFARSNNLRLIFDAAHAFGVEVDKRSVLSFGDASAISFHATKLFHTIEGGAVITQDDELAAKVACLRNFGLADQRSRYSFGINAKMNELEAAMGLCVLDDIDFILDRRRAQWKIYVDELASHVQLQRWSENVQNNGAYAPVIFETEEKTLSIHRSLLAQGVQSRRYFYPSLCSSSVIDDFTGCSNSISISERVLCLPIFPALQESEQELIISVVRAHL